MIGCSRQENLPSGSEPSEVYAIFWDADEYKGPAFYGYTEFYLDNVLMPPSRNGRPTIKTQSAKAIRIRTYVVNGTGKDVFAIHDPKFGYVNLSWSWRVADSDNQLIDQGTYPPSVSQCKPLFTLLSSREPNEPWGRGRISFDERLLTWFDCEFPVDRPENPRYVDIEATFPFEYYVLGARKPASIMVSRVVCIVQEK